MATNNIKDVKTVDAENFDYLLAESNFRIESVFRSRNKAPIICLQPIIGTKLETDNPANWVSNPASTFPGQTFDFVLDANDYSLFDLKDWVFDVQAQFYYEDESSAGNTNFTPNAPVFGNQCLFSLFQSMELYIDNVLIQRVNMPGICANAQYALRYPHTKESEKANQIHGWVLNDNGMYELNTTATSDAAGHLDTHAPNIWLAWKETQAKDNGKKQLVKIMGNIAQRIKLGDMFSVVDTLPPIYDHKVMVKLQRANHDSIICNTATLTGDLAKFIGFQKFQGFIDTYITTDQYIATAKKYYSRPIETLITQDKQLMVPIITTPTSATSQPFNLNIDAAYKNKLLTIAIPRTTNFSGQRNSNSEYLRYGVRNDVLGVQYDTFKAPANSYTHGGLKSVVISTTAGLKLYEFNMGADGVIQGSYTSFDVEHPQKQCTTNNVLPVSYNDKDNAHNVYMSNYQNVYEQYKRARLHFQQLEDEALDFDTFMKEYCIFCVDLSCFTLSPNENIRIELTFDNWSSGYNPYYAYNTTANDSPYVCSALACDLFCDKVLRLLPNRQVELADMMTTTTVEVDNSNMA